MRQALGLVEIQGLSTAIVVADTMSKAANVHILEIENTKGLGYMTIKIAGDVGAVNAAVNAGCQVGRMNEKLVSWKVIPRPSNYVGETFCNPPPEPTSPPKDAQKPRRAAKQKEAVPVAAETVQETPETAAETEAAAQVKKKAPAKRKTAAKKETPVEAAEQKNAVEVTEAVPEAEAVSETEAVPETEST